MKTPALPFGTYTVCVDSTTPGSSGARRKKTITGVRNWYAQGIKPPAATMPVIDMSPNSSTQSGACT
jgi:hypothetical protein